MVKYGELQDRIHNLIHPTTKKILLNIIQMERNRDEVKNSRKFDSQTERGHSFVAFSVKTHTFSAFILEFLRPVWAFHWRFYRKPNNSGAQ